MSSKSKKRPREATLSKAVTLSMVIFLWAWVSVFSPSEEDVKKLEAEVKNVRDSINSQRLRILDLVQALQDEYGFEVVFK